MVIEIYNYIIMNCVKTLVITWVQVITWVKLSEIEKRRN